MDTVLTLDGNAHLGHLRDEDPLFLLVLGIGEGVKEEGGEFIVLSRAEMFEVTTTSKKTNLLAFTILDLHIRRENSHISHN